MQLRRTVLTIILVFLIGCDGGSGGSSAAGLSEQSSWVARWNRIATDAVGLDHKPPEAGETRATYLEQMGPVRTARALAIVHISIADAVAAITRRFESYTRSTPVPENTSLKAAIAQAGHDTLVALYPAQSTQLDAFLAEDLGHIDDGEAKTNGIAIGQTTAAVILAARARDGAELSEPYAPVHYSINDAPGHWQRDPMNPEQIPLGAQWFRVESFVMSSATQFRCPAPPQMESGEYAVAYDEAKRLGGDGIITPTERTDEQTEIGIFWGYDGTPLLGPPPRLFNQITVQLASEHDLDVAELARLLALVNVALADTGIAVWESKYHYDYWRPVTAIRRADDDGNNATEIDPNFTPFGAQASNLSTRNFTPPFPAYPSGHAGFGGAAFETLRLFFGRDDIAFTFVSDELNGQTKDVSGIVRPLLPRSFASLSQAEEENGQSRIYLGIHWAFDKTEGINQGRNVAQLTFESIYQPLP